MLKMKPTMGHEKKTSEEQLKKFMIMNGIV